MDALTPFLQVLIVASVALWAVGLLVHRSSAGPPGAAGTRSLWTVLPALGIGLSSYPVAHLLMLWLPLAPELPRQAMSWGLGVAAGGCGALAMSRVLPATNAMPATKAMLAATPAPYLPALAVAAALILFGGAARLDALLGAAAGWLLTTSGQLHSDSAGEGAGVHHNRTATLLTAGGYSILLCLALALALIRDNTLPAIKAGGTTGGWTLAVLATALAAIPIMAAAVGEREARATGRALLLGVWLLCAGAGVVAGLGTGVTGMRTGMVLALGAAGGLLLAGLAKQTPQEERSHLAGETPLAMLLVAAGAMSAHLLLQAFGVAMLLLAAWPFAVWSRQRQQQEVYSGVLWPLLATGIAVLMHRVFDVRFGNSLHGSGWSDTYMLVGTLITALAPTAMLRLANGNSPRCALGLAGSFAIPVAVGLVSALAVVLFGLRMAPALALGCVLACAFAPVRGRTIILLSALWALLILSQWLGPLLTLADTSRSIRILILLGTTALLLVAVGVQALWRRQTVERNR